MPLKRGSSQAVISENIREMRNAGHPMRVAVVAAERKAHEQAPDHQHTNNTTHGVIHLKREAAHKK